MALPDQHEVGTLGFRCASINFGQDGKGHQDGTICLNFCVTYQDGSLGRGDGTHRRSTVGPMRMCGREGMRMGDKGGCGPLNDLIAAEAANDEVRDRGDETVVGSAGSGISG